MPPDKHIILLGFKNTGKTAVGKKLAPILKRPFIDLDEKIEADYRVETGQAFSCRMIFSHHGENFFRDRETQALKTVLFYPLSIIALGGGAPLKKENQILIKPHWMVHICAEPELVFTRIMSGGKPAYFPNDMDPKDYFRQIWHKSIKEYANLTSIKVDNSGSLEQTVDSILHEWDQAP